MLSYHTLPETLKDEEAVAQAAIAHGVQYVETRPLVFNERGAAIQGPDAVRALIGDPDAIIEVLAEVCAHLQACEAQAEEQTDEWAKRYLDLATIRGLTFDQAEAAVEQHRATVALTAEAGMVPELAG